MQLFSQRLDFFLNFNGDEHVLLDALPELVDLDAELPLPLQFVP